MEQTAVEWLAEKFINEFGIEFSYIKQAKEMEKQQIERAFIASKMTIKDAEQYYNETFKSE